MGGGLVGGVRPNLHFGDCRVMALKSRPKFVVWRGRVVESREKHRVIDRLQGRVFMRGVTVVQLIYSYVT